MDDSVDEAEQVAKRPTDFSGGYAGYADRRWQWQSALGRFAAAYCEFGGMIGGDVADIDRPAFKT